MHLPQLDIKHKVKRVPNHSINFVKEGRIKGIMHGSDLAITLTSGRIISVYIYDKKYDGLYSLNECIPEENKRMDDQITKHYSMIFANHPETAAPNYLLPQKKYTLLVWWWDEQYHTGGMFKEKFVIY